MVLEGDCWVVFIFCLCGILGEHLATLNLTPTLTGSAFIQTMHICKWIAMDTGILNTK